MKYRPRRPRSLWIRLLAAQLAIAVAFFGCRPGAKPLASAPGLSEYQAFALVPFRWGLVNAMGGNLLIPRVDLSIDTRLGTRQVAATYNSATSAWLWNLDVTYDGVTFTDETGAEYTVAALEDGAAIPGTHWVKRSTSSIQTKGGLILHFDAAGRLFEEQWADAVYPRLRYLSQTIAGAPRTTRIDQCTSATSCAEVFTLAYDAAGRLIGLSDRAGRSAEFAWDASGRLVSARDGLAVAEGWPGWSYEYSGSLLISITSSEGERIELGYGGTRVTEIHEVGPGSPLHKFAYQGRSEGLYRTRHWDPLGVERRYAYDHQRRLHNLEIVPLAEVTQWTWSGLRPDSMTDAAGVTTAWIWSDDDLATEVQPSGNVIARSYAPAGVDRERPRRRPILRVDDSLGLVEEREYDANGRLVATTNGAEETTTYTYHADGALATVTSPFGVVRQLSGYGEHGHPTSLKVGQVTADLVYDSVGNIVQGTPDGSPEWGAVYRRHYDAGRHLRGLSLASSSQPDIVIDVRSDGQPTSIRRPGAEDHEFVYDSLGRQIARRERVDSAWQTTSFEYDLVGNRTAMERPNGMRTETVWEAGRPVLFRDLRHGLVDGTLALVYADGRVVTSSDSLRGGSEDFVYDAAGRVALIDHGDDTSTLRTYDLRSRETSTAFLEGDSWAIKTIARTHDGADREIELWDDDELALRRTYDAAKLQQIEYGNGLVRSFGYEPEVGLLASALTLNAADVAVEQTTIARETVSGFVPGIRTTVDTATGAGLPDATMEDYWLGPTGHPQGKRLQFWLGGPDVRSYEFDAKSNLMGEWDNVTGRSVTFQYNAEANRLLAMSIDGGPTATYAYDEAGFAISRAGVPLTWTAGGRLASHGDDTLGWDMRGRLVSTTVEGVETQYCYGGAVQCDGAGNPLAIDLDEVVVDLSTGARAYRHLDFRGNVKFTSDDAGEVRSHYLYSPYALEAVYGEADDPVGFVTRPAIGELMILGARIYDTATGRFLSPDPIFQLVNQYSYTLGNPVWFSDPDGDLALEGAGLAIATGALFTVGSPAAAVIAGAGLTVAAIAFALALGKKVSSKEAAPAGGAGGGGSGASAGAGGLGGGCSPLAAASLPAIARALCVLGPLQLLLGLLLLRGRRRQQRSGGSARPEGTRRCIGRTGNVIATEDVSRPTHGSLAEGGGGTS